MAFVPVERMWQRVDIERQDSDAAQFLCLMYLGEMLTKVVVSGLVACIEDDVSRSRYRQRYTLVRADSIGDWVQVLDEVLKGPTAQFLAADLRQEQRELTERTEASHWQYQAVLQLAHAYESLGIDHEPLPDRIDARRWFSFFVTLRNRTRGHGATRTGLYTAACPSLEASIRLLYENFFIFRRPWAFLHQNLSGKYRVTPLSADVGPFAKLKSTPSKLHLEDGVYLHVRQPRLVELFISDPDASDFFLPNGLFNGKRFETRSYLTDTAKEQDASPYLKPANALPESETQGRDELDLEGDVFTNLPPQPYGYVKRFGLEQELISRLVDDRHPIITLLGRGGIGKTSLALATLHEITTTKRFGAILWFSARDIDLMPQGPKLVQPKVLSVREIAREFVRLTTPPDSAAKGFRDEEYLAQKLATPLLDAGTLFVFDNFETVRNPIEVYTWMSEYIRLPNKILLTTRIRDFKADYPVEVTGMIPEESDVLITQVATALSISHLITKDFRRDLIDQAEGHPYILKILLGQVASDKKTINIPRVIATKDDILDALFERTFLGLSAAAQRVFLTLSAWRSAVPELAVEAVITARTTESIDVAGAIEELTRWSLVEYLISPVDNERFLITPLAAAAFGRRKLSVSPFKAVVEADVELLHQMGGIQRTDVRHGATVRLQRLAHTLVQKIAREPSLLDEYSRVLEFLAQRVPSVWLELSRLNEEEQPKLEKAVYFTQRYLEADGLSNSERRMGWDRLSNLYRRIGDKHGEITALVERGQLNDSTLTEISAIANNINSLLRQQIIDDQAARHGLVYTLIKALERAMKSEAADATDLSRLAWLYLHVKQDNHALELAKRGLAMEPENFYCQGLVQRLQK